MSWIVTIIIGLLAGWIAEKVMKRDHGLLTNLVVGLVGALLGGWLAGILGFAGDGFIYRVIIASGGAILLLFVLAKVKGR